MDFIKPHNCPHLICVDCYMRLENDTCPVCRKPLD